MTGRAERLWEVDVARTAAIAMMVAYHVGYDIDRMAPSVGIDATTGGWRALQVACGSTFLAVVGVSAAISNGRARARGLSFGAAYRRHARRAAEVAAAALLVSAVSWIALGPTDYVRFGILHCIAVTMLVLPLLVGLRWWNAPLGVAVVAVGILLQENARSTVPGLFVLGVPQPGGQGVDWYPLLPWMGPALIGLAIGLALYPEGRRGPWGRHLAEPRAARALGAPGRHALPIYLVHQLVLIPLVAGALLLAGVELTGGFG